MDKELKKGATVFGRCKYGNLEELSYGFVKKLEDSIIWEFKVIEIYPQTKRFRIQLKDSDIKIMVGKYEKDRLFNSKKELIEHELKMVTNEIEVLKKVKKDLVKLLEKVSK